MRKDQTMKRKRHTEEQIIAILKEHEAGVKTADLCRKHGISEASFYNWKAKYGGLEVSEAKRLKGLESENVRLKKLLADAMLDNAALKDLPTGECFLRSGLDLGCEKRSEVSMETSQLRRGVTSSRKQSTVRFRRRQPASRSARKMRSSS